VAAHLFEHHDALIVPGRFFEAPHHIRVSPDVPPEQRERSLRAL
jgi:hypothetical protein